MKSCNFTMSKIVLLIWTKGMFVLPNIMEPQTSKFESIGAIDGKVHCHMDNYSQLNFCDSAKSYIF